MRDCHYTLRYTPVQPRWLYSQLADVVARFQSLHLAGNIFIGAYFRFVFSLTLKAPQLDATIRGKGAWAEVSPNRSLSPSFTDLSCY